MTPLFAKARIAHALLTLGAIAALLLIGGMALQLSGAQLKRLEALRPDMPYFAYWRALLYTLIFTGWSASLRQQRSGAGQQRLKRLGLIGFSSIIIVELSRM
ncbi:MULTISPECIES: hypothetical protein [unclassified Pseudomonas]|uniref:hypothetical protein n=1 Tax=unclassified Pseudomonas TaxID=196821 RepID=UPI0025E1314E|nr:MULTISPECIES: hypothetical protein [unclassified Pseudomonas]